MQDSCSVHLGNFELHHSVSFCASLRNDFSQKRFPKKLLLIVCAYAFWLLEAILIILYLVTESAFAKFKKLKQIDSKATVCIFFPGCKMNTSKAKINLKTLFRGREHSGKLEGNASRKKREKNRKWWEAFYKKMHLFVVSFSFFYYQILCEFKYWLSYAMKKFFCCKEFEFLHKIGSFNVVELVGSRADSFFPILWN